MPPAVGSPIAVDIRERVSAPFPSESELSPTSPGRPSSSDNPIDSPLSTDERLLAMDPGQPGSHYGNARQLSPRRGLRALQGPSFDIFAQNEVDTQGPGQDLRHPDAGTAQRSGRQRRVRPLPPVKNWTSCVGLRHGGAGQGVDSAL